MRQNDLIILKLGGSLITDKSKPFTANRVAILGFAKEIKSSIRKYKGKLIIVHGSGSFGHSVAQKYQTQEGYLDSRSVRGLSLVADAAIQINRIFVEIFLKEGVNVISFSPISFILAKSKETYTAFIDPISSALDLGVIPILYGDVVFDQKVGFCIFSGEKIINELCSRLSEKHRISKVLYASDVDGVLDRSGKVVPLVTKENVSDVLKNIKPNTNIDVTGGMYHKVVESLKLARENKLKSIIFSGKIHGNIEKGILSKPEVCTIVC